MNNGEEESEKLRNKKENNNLMELKSIRKFKKIGELSSCSSEGSGEDENLDILEENEDVKKFYIPSIENAYVFRRDIFPKHILQDKIKREDFDQIIYRAGIIFGDSLLVKRENDLFLPSKFQNAVFWYCLLSVVLFIIFFYTSLSVDTYSTCLTLYIFSLFFIGSCAVIISIRSFYSLLKKNRKYVSLNDIMEEGLKKYFSEINQKYQQKGIRFKYCQHKRRIVVKVLSSLTSL